MPSFLKPIATCSAILLSIWSIGCSGGTPSALTSSNSNSATPSTKLTQQSPESESSEEPGEAIALNALPQTIVAKVNQVVPGGAIISAALGDENGTKIYEIKTRTSSGSVVEVKVDTKGNIKPENAQAEYEDGQTDASGK